MASVRARVRRCIVILVVLAFVAMGCGDDGEVGDDASTTSTTTSTPTTSTPAPTTSTSEPPTTSDPSTTTDSPSSTVAPPTTPLPGDGLPGEPFDLAPAEGRTLAVVGVRFDDVLNVRLAPGTDQPVVAELGPLQHDFVATGRARSLPNSIWFEVTTSDGVVGWVGSRFVAQLGPVGDRTAEVIAVAGSTPEAETMTDLGTAVAEALRTDPDVPSWIVLVIEPSVGDLGEVTYDLIGIGDDATAGYRLHVFGRPTESGEGFVLKSVEATDLCQAVRGPTEPGGPCA